MSNRRVFDLSALDARGRRSVLERVEVAQTQLRAATIDETAGTLVVEATDDEAMQYLASVVAAATEAQKRLRERVLLAHVAQRVEGGDVDDALRASREVYELDEGLVGLRGNVLRLFRFFENEFLSLARSYGADENHYPVLVPLSLLERLRYFTHFPQHVTFCSHLPEDLPTLEWFAARASGGDGTVDAHMRERLAAPTHALKPAVCLPCYGQQRGRRLARDEVVAVTMQNHVLRYEGGRVRSLERLWDFSVRDVVVFGSGRDLERLRMDVMERAIALCRELDLDARIELANDPFFLDASRHKSVYQRLGEVKYELTLDLPQRGYRLAASSFNLHRDFYTSIYDIRLAEGALAETACMGFGLERWTYGFLSQKGVDPSAWPARVRRATFGSDAAGGAAGASGGPERKGVARGRVV
jgi:seryl-tRNA synthetase